MINIKDFSEKKKIMFLYYDDNCSGVLEKPEIIKMYKYFLSRE